MGHKKKVCKYLYINNNNKNMKKKEQYILTFSLKNSEDKNEIKNFCITKGYNMSEFIRRTIKKEIERYWNQNY